VFAIVMKSWLTKHICLSLKIITDIPNYISCGSKSKADLYLLMQFLPGLWRSFESPALQFTFSYSSV
jgi:hypothetical protein